MKKSDFKEAMQRLHAIEPNSGAYNLWAEENFDRLKKAERLALMANLTSIVASAGSLLCALYDREIMR